LTLIRPIQRLRRCSFLGRGTLLCAILRCWIVYARSFWRAITLSRITSSFLGRGTLLRAILRCEIVHARSSWRAITLFRTLPCLSGHVSQNRLGSVGV
jgi:hypothetical protein